MEERFVAKAEIRCYDNGHLRHLKMSLTYMITTVVVGNTPVGEEFDIATKCFGQEWNPFGHWFGYETMVQMMKVSLLHK